jgi:RNA polymerase sigma factor (sigma-70 family)
VQSGAGELNLTNEDMTRLYDDNAEDLLRFFARRTVDAQVALDLVSETFAEAISSRESFRGDSDEDGRRWLYGIARNLMNNYFRRGQVEQRAIQRLRFEPVEVSKADAEQIEELATLAAMRSAVEDALGSLKPEYRDAVRARVLDQREYGEIALSVGTTEDVIRARVSRGLKKLKKELERVRKSMEADDE